MFRGIILLLSLTFFYKSAYSTDYDKGLESMDNYVIVRVFGYENLGNKGTKRGCCDKRSDLSCLPCQYKAVFKIRMNNAFVTSYSYSYDYYKYEIGTFSKESSSLFETFYFERTDSWYKSYVRNIEIYSTKFVKAATDIYETFDYYTYGTFPFDGVYGLNGKIKLWYTYELKPYRLDSSNKFIITINSLIFKSYSLADSGECCNNYDEELHCPISCSFKISIKTSNYYSTTTRDISGLSSSNFYNLNLPIIITYNNFLQSDDSLKFKVLSSSNKEIIDEFSTDPLTLYPNRYNTITNLESSFNNMVANITINANCIGYTGKNCDKYCKPLKNIEYCDDIKGSKVCLNGATDELTCDKFTTSCSPNPCYNNGVCRNKNDGFLCICPNGYQGKYCENFECKNNCNNRGSCVSPNKCLCHYPFTGQDCQQQVCSEGEKLLCLNNGTCSYENNKVKCECVNDQFYGKYCEIPHCPQKCIYGKCQFFSKTGKSSCDCYKGYNGTACETKIKSFAASLEKTKDPYKGVLAAVVVGNLVLVLLLVLLKMNILQRKTYKFKIDESF